MDKIYKDRFIWDEAKNQENIEKHGISFEQVADIFEDPFAIDIFDDENSSEREERFKRIAGKWFVYYTIIYTERGKLTRLISAWQSSSEERKLYEREFKAAMGIR